MMQVGIDIAILNVVQFVFWDVFVLLFASSGNESINVIKVILCNHNYTITPSGQ